ncbi:putative THO complex subunit 6 [Cocos nucifera]|uniref:Putative THO complex subunit 6 n=1 Tax=Cocos nucifera TaxID=13894 RepID=A0A8K0IA22_COCNU|nr:putative THO complex subunit 6 [Cocos nucifera]
MARCREGGGGGDARNWDEEGYRKSILRERELHYQTAFRTAFAPSLNPTPETLIVASSDGSLASYSISACISSATQLIHFNRKIDENCGDDGRIRGWKLTEALNSDVSMGMQGNHLKPLLDLVNPQHEKDPFIQLLVMLVHIVGMWRLGKGKWFSGGIQITCIVSLLACGTGSGLSVWSLLSCECIFSSDSCAPVQDLLFQDNQVLTVGSEPVLTRFGIYGVVLSQIKCAPQSAFSISLHPSGLAFPDAVYLVDAVEGGKALMEACKPAIESGYITKVIHDCKRDSEALYFQFGIKLHNVVDTQIAYSLIEEQEGRKRSPDDYISFVGLLADPRYGGKSYLEKEEVRVLLKQDPAFWTYRPMSEMMIRAAADDVRFLLYIYHKMMEKLNKRSLWHLAVRGSLYCRCFCINDIDFADWPPLPTLPGLTLDLLKSHPRHLQVNMELKLQINFLAAEGYVPEEEILSVLNVPPGKMGRVIGKRGASIRSVKQSCNAEILIGGAKGPPDKVFIIGPVMEVRKAEAILRGRMIDL